MNERKRATLADLAEATGLSINTVSRALANKDGVAERTRRLVVTEAERIGYVTPAVARRATASRTVALVVTSSTNVFISQLITAIEATLRAQGYSLELSLTEESLELEREVLTAIEASDAAGAIVLPVGDAATWPPLTLPIVAVARELPALETDFVAMDQHAAMVATTRHALAQGARSLYFFDEQLDVSSNRTRVQAFEEAVATEPEATGHVIPIPTRRFESRTTPWQPEEAQRAVAALLDEGATPDALLFEDDYYCLGAMRALAEAGLRVPEDVLVLGYGGHPYGPYLQPSLTTVSVPVALIAEAAVSMVLRRIAGDDSPPQQRLLTGELVVRESSVGLQQRRDAGQATGLGA